MNVETVLLISCSLLPISLAKAMIAVLITGINFNYRFTSKIPQRPCPLHAHCVTLNPSSARLGRQGEAPARVGAAAEHRTIPNLRRIPY